MTTVRMRLTAGEDVARRLIDDFGLIEGVERAEEVADLMPHMNDPDSSSAGLPDDTGPGFHAIVVEAGDATVAQKVRDLAETRVAEHGAGVEFVERF